MKLILGLVVFSILLLGVMSIPSADAAVGKLTIRAEIGTIYFNESVYYKGKLTDSQGYAISFERINIWEKVNGEWQYVTQGKTDARGEYKITIPANHWNYAKTVNIVANSASSIQSPSVTLKIEKPYSYQIKQQTNNYVQTTLSNEIQSSTDTRPTADRLTLQYKIRNIIVNQPVTFSGQLTDEKGWSISGADIVLWEKDSIESQLLGMATTDSNGKYQVKVIAKYWDGDGEAVEIFANSALFGAIYSPTLKIDLKQSFYQATQNDATKTQSTEINSYKLYKDPSYKIKSSYYDAIKKLETGLKLSESSHEEIVFENSEANKKKDSAWDMRWTVVTSINDGKEILRQAESCLKNQQYQKAWEKLHEIDREISNGNSHISDIAQEIKSAKDAEYNYQEKNKTCFLFWCDVKDQNKDLNIKIKDLELKVEQIKNKQKDITLLYQMGVQNKKFVEQEYQSTLEQDKLIIAKEMEKMFAETKQSNLESEKRQAELLATEKQQRLEEQRLQEQRQYEEELRQQRIQAEQKQQRLEEQRQIDSEKSRIKLAAKNSPLIKGWMTGELSFYVKPFTIPVSQNVRDSVERLASWMDGTTINGIKLKRSYDKYSDFSFNFVKDYQGEVIGRQVGDYLIVGLDSTSCDGLWKPFDGTTVYRLMYHEMGHAMGQDHNSNSDNVMYKSIKNAKYEYEVKDSIILNDGWWHRVFVCGSGTYSFQTERTSSSGGYKSFVIPSNTDPLEAINLEVPFYLECSDYKNEMKSTGGLCPVESGSALVLYNPSVFGKGGDIPINIEIIDKSSAGTVNYSFNSDDRYFSDEYLFRIYELFR